MKKFNLWTYYKSDDDLHLFLKKVMAIVLLIPSLMDNAFKLLQKKYLNNKKLKRFQESLKKCMMYVNKQWLKSEMRTMITFYEVEFKTNNCLQFFFTTRGQQNHLSIWLLIQLLIFEETAVRMKHFHTLNGFYRVYNHEQEVEKLIQFGFNELKYNGQLPIVADYTSFALHNKFYVSRERYYDVTKLGARKQTHKHPLATVAATTITSTASSSRPDGHSTDDEDSVNTDPQQSLSIVPTTLAATTKTISPGNKKRKNKDRLTGTTRSTPAQDRLRVRTKESAVATSPSASSPQPAIATKPMQPKTVVSATRKRGRVLEHEENDENNGDTPGMLDCSTTTSTNGKAMKAKNRATTNKRMKK
ncbi:unnamed protein product [Rotaria socialis]